MTYGPWGIVAGGSDGVGAAFARAMAARGINVVLVARRVPVLEAFAGDLREKYGVEVRPIALDLSAPGALAELSRATADLEVGLFVYNAGADDRGGPFLDKDLDAHLEMVHRNCASVLEAAYRFGAPMVSRGRGGVVLVTSGAAWAGGATLATYGATKAFDLILAESLWAEWRTSGVDVLALVLGRTDTPSHRRMLAAQGRSPNGPDTQADSTDRPAAQDRATDRPAAQDESTGRPAAQDRAIDGLADPDDVVAEAFDHLADGPTWISGSADPTGGSPFGALSRRDAVLAMSRGAARAK